MKSLSHILKYVKQYKVLVLFNVLCNIGAVVFSLFSLAMIIPFLDLIFLRTEAEKMTDIENKEQGFSFSVDGIKEWFYQSFSEYLIADPENGRINALIFLCVLIVIAFFFKNLFTFLAKNFMARIRSNVLKDLRNRIFRKSLKLPLSYYSEERKGDIIARMTTDVQEIEWTIMTSLEMLFRDPFTLITFLAVLVVMSPQLTLFVFVLLPIAGIMIARIGKSLKRTSVKGQNKMGELISSIEETLTGMRIIKAFAAEDVTEHKFKRLNESYTHLLTSMYMKRALSSPLSEFLGVMVLVVIIWFGGGLVLSKDSSVSASVFIAYIAIFSQLIPPAKSFTNAYYNLQKGAASEKRIEEILNADNPIKEKEHTTPINDFKEKIEYKNVSFKYEKEPVLDDVSLTIEKGQMVALVGPSGSGKSTMADLLPRFYDPVKGAIFIDGKPITDYKINDIRNLMGIVTQESILFNDSIFNNIAYAQSASLEEVENAAKIANADEFIAQMEKGYQTNIGDMGSKLSGGQRQRISIARAILVNPPILILDEATSSLDTESESLVQEALNNLMKSRTSLVIAHRLSTIQNADCICVLQEGKIVETGTHKELLDKNGAYRKLHDLQSFE